MQSAGVRTTTDAFMVGMPGETRGTVIESAKFVAKLRYLLDMDWDNSYPNWTIAIPGTPLYEYCQQIGLIGKTPEEEENYMIKTALQFDDHGVLNYLNKTNFDRKEIHFWTYLYRYVGKKAYSDLILNKKINIQRLKELNQKCMKFSFNVFFSDFRRAKNKKLNFKDKIKSYLHVFSKLFLSLSLPFISMNILVRLVKLMSDIKFKDIIKYKAKYGEEKYNFFVDRKEINEELEFKDYEIDQVNKSIDRSLRKIVINNRNKLPKPVTVEEKGLELLATGR